MRAVPTSLAPQSKDANTPHPNALSDYPVLTPAQAQKQMEQLQQKMQAAAKGFDCEAASLHRDADLKRVQLGVK